MKSVAALMPLSIRATGIIALAVALEWGRVLVLRGPQWQFTVLLAGGLALCALGIGHRPADLGLGTTRLGERLVGGLALGAVLLLPAAARWGGGPLLAPEFAIAAVAVSVGEEVAFRGVVFTTLRHGYGPAAAVLGSTAAWTVAHVLSHPPAFLPAVAAAGLLLGIWRWALGDLVGPIVGHVLADLAL